MIQWRPDVLGDGFEQLTFELGPDDDPGLGDGKGATAGESDAQQPPVLVGTLIRSLPAPRTLWQRVTGQRRDLEDVDVLYLHGWSDYFFQTELARFWTDRGARFFAVDLRRYGRSLRPGQTAGYVDDLDDYDAEIEFALAEMRASSPRNAGDRKVVLLGHSTGGLVLSLWASRHPGVVDALILNSPWLELQLSTRGRQVIAPIVNLGAKLSPLEGIPQLDYGFYSRAVRQVGPQDEVARINPEWKPDQSHPVHTGWLRAILAGHDRVYRGLNIDVPVCVLLSTRSALPARWSEELTRTDTVLDVDGIARAALKLGRSVTIERIPEALHDVFMSSVEPRRDAFDRLERFAKGWRRAIG